MPPAGGAVTAKLGVVLLVRLSVSLAPVSVAAVKSGSAGVAGRLVSMDSSPVLTSLVLLPAASVVVAVMLSGCGEKKTELGQGGSVVSGSAEHPDMGDLISSLSVQGLQPLPQQALPSQSVAQSHRSMRRPHRLPDLLQHLSSRYRCSTSLSLPEPVVIYLVQDLPQF